MKNKFGQDISSLLDNSSGLNNLAPIFAILDELNQLLTQVIPPHLTKYCRIGAIDSGKNLVVLYLEQPELKHILNGMANQILEHFHNHHFTFAGLVTRIRPPLSQRTTQKKAISPESRQKLQQLATSIDRDDLIKDAVSDENTDEINF